MAEGHYGHGSEAYGAGNIEHSKDGMSHASHKNVSPAFDTGFYHMDDHLQGDVHKADRGFSPTDVVQPQAAGHIQKGASEAH